MEEDRKIGLVSGKRIFWSSADLKLRRSLSVLIISLRKTSRMSRDWWTDKLITSLTDFLLHRYQWNSSVKPFEKSFFKISKNDNADNTDKKLLGMMLKERLLPFRNYPYHFPYQSVISKASGLPANKILSWLKTCQWFPNLFFNNSLITTDMTLSLMIIPFHLTTLTCPAELLNITWFFTRRGNVNDKISVINHYQTSHQFLYHNHHLESGWDVEDVSSLGAFYSIQLLSLVLSVLIRCLIHVFVEVSIWKYCMNW